MGGVASVGRRGYARARPKTEELGHIWYQEVAQGGLITSRHGMGSPGGAHAGGWWPEMTRITDCSAGLGCFEERVGGHEWARARQTDRQLPTMLMLVMESWHCGVRNDSFHR